MSRSITISLPVTNLATSKAFYTALGFTTRLIPPRTSSEVAMMLSCDSRHEVVVLNQTAAEYGGTVDINPKQDEKLMYGRDFSDPDGHVWGAIWMELRSPA